MLEIECLNCKKTKSVSHSASLPPPEICHECEQKEKETKKQLYLDSLKKLSLEERLSRLEKIQYDTSHEEKYNNYYDRLIG